MAYGLKYYSSVSFGEGRNYRLNIYEKDYTGIYRRIGDIASVSIGYDGGNNDFYAPIIKSAMNIVLVDSRDKEQTPLVQDSVKYGAWEEFFTPDATKYKVELVLDNTVRWSGYITPDSWEEDLVYRGKISITARDNIGHLADFDFDGADDDTSNLASLDDIITAAMTKIGQSWASSVGYQNMLYWYTKADGTQASNSVGNTMFDQEAFKGMNWYEVLEETLSSLGLCLRWFDMDQRMIVTPIRYISELNAVGHRTVPVVAAQFVNGSGHRVLNPAYKAIVDKCAYKTNDNDSAIESYVASPVVISSITYPMSKLTGKWTIYGDYLKTVNPKDAETYPTMNDDWKADDSLMLRASTNDSLEDECAYLLRLFSNEKVKISFDITRSYFEIARVYGVNKMYMLPYLNLGRNIKMKYSLEWISYDQSEMKYWSGSAWDDNLHILYNNISVNNWNNKYTTEFEVTTGQKPGYLRFVLYSPYAQIDSSYNGRLFVRYSGITFERGEASHISSNVVTTNYDQKQNVLLTREPKLCQYPTRIYPGLLSNIMYADDYINGYPSITGWSFENAAQEYDNIAVAIHKELLLIHGAPLSLLSGELMDATNGEPAFDVIWIYGDKKLMLTGGSLNIGTDRVEDAYLQEYLDWDDVWNN